MPAADPRERQIERYERGFRRNGSRTINSGVGHLKELSETFRSPRINQKLFRGKAPVKICKSFTRQQNRVGGFLVFTKGAASYEEVN